VTQAQIELEVCKLDGTYAERGCGISSSPSEQYHKQQQ
jgi:hypothetical protein